MLNLTFFAQMLTKKKNNLRSSNKIFDMLASIPQLISLNYTLYIFTFSIITIMAESQPEKMNFEQLKLNFQSHCNLENYEAALPFTIEGRNRAFQEFGKFDTLFADFTHDLGDLYRLLGKHKKAEKLYLEALQVKAQTIGKKQLSYATTLNNIGLLNWQMGQYESAKSYYIEAVKIMKITIGATHISYLKAIANLASLYHDMGNFEQAEYYYQELLILKTKYKGKITHSQAYWLNNAASLYKDMGNFQQGESLYLEALQIIKKTKGTNHYSYWTILNNLGLLHSYLNNYDKAEQYYNEALHYQKKPGSTLLNNFALLYHKMGQYEKAKPLYIKALRIDAKELGKEHPSYFISLHNLANLYKEMNQYDHAELNYHRALQIASKTLGNSHPKYIKLLNRLADLYLAWGKTNQALKYIHLSLQSATQEPRNTKIDSIWVNQIANTAFSSYQHLKEVISSLNCLNSILAKTKNPTTIHQQRYVTDLAIKLLSKGKNIITSDQDKLRLLVESHQWMQRSFQILNLERDLPKAFQLAELHKSVLLMESLNGTKAYQLGNIPDSLKIKEKNLFNKQADLKAILQKIPAGHRNDSLLGLLNTINIRINSFKKNIESTYPNYAKLKYQYPSVSIEELQQKLNRQSAIIEFVVGDSAIYVFYIDKSQTTYIKKTIDFKLFKTRIDDLHQTISDYSYLSDHQLDVCQQYTKNAYWCYEHLLKPLLENRQNINHLIIIPDGPLVHLPFESFLTKKATPRAQYHQLRYLIEKFQISYHYSATLWSMHWLPKKLHHDVQNDNRILALAANYGTLFDSSHTTTQLPAHRRLRDQLGGLPAAKMEVEMLAQEFNGFFGFDSLATEQNFKNRAHKYGVIHLAMHGVLNKNKPTLSGLVFTEDQGHTEDNILQAYEISKLQLNAKLVVLSACQTGFGKFEQGNGVASLARAFMYAGVPSLIVTLWQVDDMATAKIMKEFYLNLSRQLPKAEALRQAKLHYIKNTNNRLAHPAYWSSYIHIGANEPILIERKTLSIHWLIAGSIVILVFVLFLNRIKISSKNSK